MNNLPACPFCRSEEYVFKHPCIARSWRVVCERPEDDCGGCTRWYSSREMAVEAWVKHAGPIAKMIMGGGCKMIKLKPCPCCDGDACSEFMNSHANYCPGCGVRVEKGSGDVK